MNLRREAANTLLLAVSFLALILVVRMFLNLLNLDVP